MSPEFAAQLRDYLISQINEERPITRRVLAAVPQDRSSYKPSEKCMSALALASHIASSEVFFLRGIAAGQFARTPVEHKTIDEVLRFYDEEAPKAADAVAALPGERLVAALPFANFTLPAVQCLTIALKHGIHHRGQLSSYLRPMGSRVPSIYGPSGDEG
jgi:uncharacterized damage-inducible protein DinB